MQQNIFHPLSSCIVICNSTQESRDKTSAFALMVNNCFNIFSTIQCVYAVHDRIYLRNEGFCVQVINSTLRDMFDIDYVNDSISQLIKAHGRIYLYKSQQSCQ